MPTEEQVPSDVQVKDLNVDTLISLDRAMRPTAQEVCAMVHSLCSRKLWSRAKLATLLCINPHDLSKIERGVQTPTGTLTRLIWMLWAFDTKPEILTSLLHLATWGKTTIGLPVRQARILTGEEREKAIAWIKNWENEPEYVGLKLTIPAIQGKLGIGYHAAYNLCRSIGYRPADKRNKSYRTRRTPDVIKPHSIWIHVDWTKSDAELSRQTKATYWTTRAARIALRRIQPKVLRRHLQACGVENIEEKFAPIFKNHIPRRRKGVKPSRRPPNVLEMQI